MRLPALVAAALISAACSASSSSGSSAESKKKDKQFSLFVTTELKGTTEPCGCNSDPMGDLARTAALIREARSAGPVVVVDGGSLLYSVHTIPEHLEAQERRKAALIVEAFTDEMAADGVGLGPYDLAEGAAAVRPPRQVVNLAEDAEVPTAAPRVVEAGGVKVGIFGVVGAGVTSSIGVEATDPVPAARAAVEDLRKQGARVVVGLAHMARSQAQDLARQVPGMDVVVVGQNAPDKPGDVRVAPDKVGDAWLVQPADRGQVVTRLDVTIRDGGGGLADAIGRARAEVEIERLEGRLTALRDDLSRWKSDPNADPQFIATKEGELPELAEAIERLKKTPLQIPDEGSYFVMTQVPIKRALPCDQKVQSMKLAYDKAVGEANLEAAAGVEPPEPDEGAAGYEGIEECSYCHSAAVDFWKKTRHAAAWETLEDIDKQFNYECISCHVTGWDEPGGATLAHNESLRDVQCETCHGPGSIHVEEDGKESPKTMVLTPPESLCIGCHNEEHSDTFDYEAYLRDVTGPGHGEEFRNKLGDGPTGHELRSEALRKAGLEIGKGCLK